MDDFNPLVLLIPLIAGFIGWFTNWLAVKATLYPIEFVGIPPLLGWQGVIPKNKCEEYVIICGVFIHPEAEDDTKIYDYNYEATKQAIERAMKGEPTADEMVQKKDKAKHPFSPK